MFSECIVFPSEGADKYTYEPGIYGKYVLQNEAFNGKAYYKKGERFAIFWDGNSDNWVIGLDEDKERKMELFAKSDSAYYFGDQPQFDTLWELKQTGNVWKPAGESLRMVCGKYLLAIFLYVQIGHR